MNLVDAVARLTAPLANRVRLMVARGVLRAVADSPKLQELQVELLAGELRDRLERFQEYGFTSHPHPGAEAVTVFVGGNRDHGLVIACDDRRYRLTGLETGEVALFTDEDQDPDGCRIVLRRGNRVQVQARNVDLRAEERLHLSGREVHLHADERLIRETHGYGDALVHSGGASWRTETWHQGATLVPGTEHGIQPPAVASGEYAAAKAAILASPDCTDTDRLLLCIPDIAEAQGWMELSAFLRKWFAASASTDKDAAEPSFVEWDWLLQYGRVRTAWDHLAKAWLFNQAGEAELASILSREGLIDDAPHDFDHINAPVESLYSFAFQRSDLDYYESPWSLIASMGRFSIYALAKGRVEPFASGHRVTVEQVAFFVRDSFDFEGEQELGFWNCRERAFTNPLEGKRVCNSYFRIFRQRHQKGGDFYVYVMPRIVDSFKEYAYEM